MTARHSDSSIRTGGLALLAAALGFIAVFAYLAVRFDYPDVLEAPAATALPALLSMGPTGRAVWGLYGLLPLLLVPAAIGALARRSEGQTKTACAWRPYWRWWRPCR
jgi:hypothetical protein